MTFSKAGNQFTPDFIGVGAQRSGTSWLYHCLNSHPEIYMPGKELQFFNQERADLEDYAKLFEGIEGSTVKGEITPDYMSSKIAIERIKTHYPNVKIIVILREPLERALSAFSLYKLHGDYTNTSFDQAIQKDKMIIKKSFYFPQLERLLHHFPRSSVHVELYDNIASNPEALIKRVYSFLGVDSDYMPESLNQRRNSSGNVSLQKKIKLPQLIWRIENSPLKGLYHKVKKLRIARWAKTKLIDSDHENKYDFSSVPRNLIEELYDDVVKLEGLLGQSLSPWKSKLEHLMQNK